MDTYDKDTNQKIAAFHARMERNAQFFQRAALFMAATRLVRDADERIGKPGWRRLVTRPARWLIHRRVADEVGERRQPTIKIIRPRRKNR